MTSAAHAALERPAGQDPDRRRRHPASRRSSTPRCTTRCCTRTCSATSTVSTWASTTRCTRPPRGTSSTPTTPAGTSTAARCSSPRWSRPQQTSDSVRSMLDQYDQTGQLPKWELNNGESYVMVGDPGRRRSSPTRTRSGPRDFDTAHALSAMQTEANQPNNIRPALTPYLDNGYIPLDGTYGCCNFYGAVSTQQEYNTADHAIARFAAALGKTSIATTFAAARQQLAERLQPGDELPASRRYVGRPFESGFTPSTSTGFVEGTSAQYTPMEPFDVDGPRSPPPAATPAWIAKLDAADLEDQEPEPAQRRLRQRAEHRDPVGVRLRRRAVEDAAGRASRSSSRSSRPRPAASPATTTSAR